MTISSEDRVAGPFIGNDVTVAFPFTFKVFTAADVRVVQTDVDLDQESDLVLNTDYTVSLNANQNTNPGGTVTLTSALVSGMTLTITSSLSYLQPTDLTNQGGFYPSVITNALDRLTIFAQQLDEQIERSIKIPLSTTGSVSTQLPSPEANALLGWNVDADAIQNVDPTTLATIVAYGTARADTFTGDGVTTQFSLTNNPGAQANLDVSIGGVTQTPVIDYVWSGGTTVTFTSAPPNGVTVLVRYMQGLPYGIGDAASIAYSPVGGAGTRLVTSKFNEVISLFDFMTEVERTAVSARTNSVDVTLAVQAAYDYAYANNINYLYAPPGVYRLSARIRAKRYTCLEGAGAWTQFYQSADTDAFVFDEAVEGVLGREIKFKNFFVTKASKTATVCYGINLVGTTNNIWGAVIEGVTSSKFYHGARVKKPILCTISRNEWEDNVNDGCRIEGDGTSVTYVNNWGRVNGGYGLRVIGSIAYSHFDNNATDGNALGGSFFGKDGAALWPLAITITAQGAEGNTGDGLKIEDGEDYIINSPYMYLNGGDGMEFSGARGVVVNGGKCLSNAGWQVRASTSGTPKIPSTIVLIGCSLSATGLGRISDTTIVSEVLSPDNGTVRFARPLEGLTLLQNGVTIMNGNQVLQNLGVGSQTYHWIKQTITFANFASAATTVDYDLPVQVPDGSYIVDAVWQLTTEFSGGAVASATMALGDSGAVGGYLTAVNVFTGAGTGYKSTNVTDRGTRLLNAGTTLRAPVFAGARTIRSRLVVTGANANALTQGAMTIWVGVIKLN